MGRKDSREENTWGVASDITDEKLAADLATWNWGDLDVDKADTLFQEISISAATLVLQEIRDQTMATLDDDGDTVFMGLFEFDMNLTVSLSELIEEWIDGRVAPSGDPNAKTSGEEVQKFIEFAERLEMLARKLRDALP